VVTSDCDPRAPDRGADARLSDHRAAQPAERGMWRVSAGSVYPTLQQLEDEGLVRASSVSRKVHVLTDDGKTPPLAPPRRRGRGTCRRLRRGRTCAICSQSPPVVWQVSPRPASAETVARAGQSSWSSALALSPACPRTSAGRHLQRAAQPPIRPSEATADMMDAIQVEHRRSATEERGAPSTT